MRRAAATRRTVKRRLVDVALVRPLRNFGEMEQLPEVFEMLASLRGRLGERIRPYHVQCEEVIAGLIREGCGQNLFRVADADETARAYYGAFDVAFVWAMQGMDRKTLETALTDLARLLFSGLTGTGRGSG